MLRYVLLTFVPFHFVSSRSGLILMWRLCFVKYRVAQKKVDIVQSVEQFTYIAAQQ